MVEKRTFYLTLAIVLILVLAAPLSAARKGDRTEEPPTRLAEEHIQGTLISWEPNRPFERARLVVSGSLGVLFEGDFEAGFPLVFELLDQNGNPLPDGKYSYELSASPILDSWVRSLMEAARESEDGSAMSELRSSGALPDRQEMILTGSFTVAGGMAVEPDLPEETGRGSGSPGPRYLQGSAAPQDFVINDDLIVDGSACIGFDCVNGEAFGFDTIRLKENNLRIRADDTSVAASFPKRDWQILFNDSANGGLERFSVEDNTDGRLVFTLEGGAPANCIYCKSNGNVGLGTNNPVLQLHIKDGNTPAVRLEQDGTSGFTPQTWDIAGNETNFFVRDATGGSALPFRIQPGAASNSLFIGSDEEVGLGTSSPDARLHIDLDTASAAPPAILVNNDTGGGPGNGEEFRVTIDQGVQEIRLREANGTPTELNIQLSNNGANITLAGTGGAELRITPNTVTVNNNLNVTGTLTKGAGAFKIDHPLDPANKFLLHSFVESPEMMNIYNGNVVLDESGEARVELPEWFEALNKEFRYQLTSIGAPNPGLYVAEKISGNQFRIAGGQPGSEVSWMVTGVRQDAYAKAYPISVEMDKPANQRGSYLNPELFKTEQKEVKSKIAVKDKKK